MTQFQQVLIAGLVLTHYWKLIGNLMVPLAAIVTHLPDVQITVGTAGPQPQVPDHSGHYRTSTHNHTTYKIHNQQKTYPPCKGKLSRQGCSIRMPPGTVADLNSKHQIAVIPTKQNHKHTIHNHKHTTNNTQPQTHNHKDTQQQAHNNQKHTKTTNTQQPQTHNTNSQPQKQPQTHNPNDTTTNTHSDMGFQLHSVPR